MEMVADQLQRLQVFDQRPSLFFSQLIAKRVAAISPAWLARIVDLSLLNGMRLLVYISLHFSYFPSDLAMIVVSFFRPKAPSVFRGTSPGIEQMIERGYAAIVQIGCCRPNTIERLSDVSMLIAGDEFLALAVRFLSEPGFVIVVLGPIINAQCPCGISTDLIEIDKLVWIRPALTISTMALGAVLTKDSLTFLGQTDIDAARILWWSDGLQIGLNILERCLV